MNKILKISFVMLLSLNFFACSEDEVADQQGNQLNEALNLMIDKGLIVNSEINSDIVSIVYSDGIELNFDINNEVEITAFNESNQKVVSTSFEEDSNSYSISQIEFYEKENGTLTLRNPDHEGQDFCECYQNDVDEFCDGLVGCVALLHPLVQAVIIAHCVIEVGTECDD